MGFFARIFGRFFRRIFQRYIEAIICLHFCRFKQGGSDFGYTHVHILGGNPAGATGVGHDDHTNPQDPNHNTVSDPSGCTFRKKSAINPIDVEQGESETIFPHNLGAQVLTTAYFHECVEDGKCPKGFTRIRCRCGGAEGEVVERCVCYTLEHEVWEGWYEERRWPDRSGEYRFPHVNIAGVLPKQLACGKTVALYRFDIEVVVDPANYRGPAAKDNALLRKIEAELRAAAAAITCEPPCKQNNHETWRGWKCEEVSPGVFHAIAAMQWEVKCQTP